MQENFPDIDYDLVFSVADDEDFPAGSPFGGAGRNPGEENPTPEGADRLSQRYKAAAVTPKKAEEEVTERLLPVREHFPAAEDSFPAGESDGKVCKVVFRGKNGEAVYDLVKAYLKDQGYADIPLPRDFAELSKFRIPARNKQILLFEDNGYTHNPVKILFPKTGTSNKILTVELYNEAAENHLLRFHGKLS